jgi:hypothetical protein
VKELALLMNVERRGLLCVKWAKSFPASGACAFELHVSPYDVDDIRTFSDVVNFLAWQQRQIKPAPKRNWVVVNNPHAGSVKKNLNSQTAFQLELYSLASEAATLHQNSGPVSSPADWKGRR